MIYDCFHFFNELDLLELRLNIMNEYVDKFVIVEANKTHLGKDKEFIFDKNKKRYAKFLDKIIHIKVEDVPELDSTQKDEFGNKWIIENYIRDQIIRGLNDCKPNDILIISDCDEIINPKIIKKIKSGIYSPELKLMYYYLNCICVTRPIWTLAKICRYEDLINPKQDFPLEGAYAFSKKGLPTYLRFCDGKRIKNGGWHFSYIGGVSKIKEKIDSLVESSSIKISSDIEKTVMENKDIFERGLNFITIKIDNSFPKYIKENEYKLANFIKTDNQVNYKTYIFKHNLKKILKNIFSVNIKKNNFRLTILGINIKHKVNEKGTIHG